MNTTKTILIGDIHGCRTELLELLERVSPGAEDRIVLMGDLVNKGPDPEGVLEIYESLGALCLRGNHDHNHLEWHAGRASPKPESVRTRGQMSAAGYGRYLEAVARMPLFFESPDLIAVHGYLLNDRPLSGQLAEILIGETNLDPSWKDHLELDRPLVVGHKRYSAEQSVPCVIEGKFYGLDTGCVYGGALTALIMPTTRIVQVPARRNYSRDE